METGSGNYAAPLLVVGCVVFGLGSLIVKFVDVGSYAIAFWRLLIAAPIFFLLGRFSDKKCPQKKNGRLRNLIRRFPRIRPRSVARKHSRRRPRHFHLAQQPADFLFSRHRLLLLFGTSKHPANFKFDIGHHRRSLNRQSRVRS